MHPLIRVLCFLVLAGALATGQAATLSLGGLLLGLAYLLHNRTAKAHLPTAHAAWGMLRRMRWLLLSLLVIYLWFTPGQPVLPYPGMPSVEGIEAGGLRSAALIMLVFAVSLLLRSSTRAELVAALDGLCRPLVWIGAATPGRLALRVTLTLELIATQPLNLSASLKRAPGMRPLARLSTVAASVFCDTVARAEQMPSLTIEVQDYGPPPLHQWLYPLVLGGAFVLVGLLSF